MGPHGRPAQWLQSPSLIAARTHRRPIRHGLLQHARVAFRTGAYGDDGVRWEVANRGGNGILDELPSHTTTLGMPPT
jgi:hypothetical protein